MHNRRIFCVILTLTLAIGMIFQAAEAVDEVALSTSNDIYYNGDHVVIFGNVNTFFENLPITIQIYHETNLVSVDQVPVAKDGTFVSSFYATGSKWKDEGTYTIRAQYTPTQIAETTFEFFGQAIDKSSAVFPVDIPNSGTFDVGYTVRGGEVKNIIMNQERYSLIIETIMTSNGNLVLKLPRDSFDAQNDDADTTFIILISKQNNMAADFTQVEYEEIAVSPDYRTIRIPLEEGDKWVEVIGTYVIPEFGSMVAIILVVAVSSAIIVSKSKFSVRYN
ncbi:PEFG-CTERM sorting domain-containing protein [Marine Group I thaumarchaeote]|uniref:PEFG-CTERM sorting domain-containing protein n=1 Tax=Marine Group I thaumarchaeote TaxID=2511932 RepID=A0A7K4NTN9_9ARCH|nr:PEFG-CTERM sorting domain-containing protein [Marine Group I thaumarchaeote]